jgi:hypothetical protein
LCLAICPAHRGFVYTQTDDIVPGASTVVAFSRQIGTGAHTLGLRVRGTGTVRLEFIESGGPGADPVVQQIDSDEWVWVYLTGFSIPQGHVDNEQGFTFTISGDVQVYGASLRPAAEGSQEVDLEGIFEGILKRICVPTSECVPCYDCEVDCTYDCDPCCEITNDGHDMPETWTVVTPAECGVDGLERRDCERDNCDHYETRPIGTESWWAGVKRTVDATWAAGG